jgi:AcrR family transcriptional regulator
MAGRPRSARAHGSVLDAAVTLFAERGIDGASMDAIARVSGVSKATIYKHWPNKDALALETLEHLHHLDHQVDVDTDDVVADITTVLARRPTPRTAQLRGAIMPHLIAYAARHPDFNKVWRMRMLEPSRTRLTRLLQRAIAEGRLPLGFDCTVGVALLLGPMLYNWMTAMSGAALPDDMPTRIVDAFWRAHSVGADPSPSPSPRKRGEGTRNRDRRPKATPSPRLRGEGRGEGRE